MLLQITWLSGNFSKKNIKSFGSKTECAFKWCVENFQKKTKSLGSKIECAFKQCLENLKKN